MDNEMLKIEKSAVNIGLDTDFSKILSTAISVRDNFYKKRIAELKRQLHYAKCAYEIVLENNKINAQDTVERLKLFEKYDKTKRIDIELENYFNETPPEKVKEDWEKLEEFDSTENSK